MHVFMSLFSQKSAWITILNLLKWHFWDRKLQYGLSSEVNISVVLFRFMECHTWKLCCGPLRPKAADDFPGNSIFYLSNGVLHVCKVSFHLSRCDFFNLTRLLVRMHCKINWGLWPKRGGSVSHTKWYCEPIICSRHLKIGSMMYFNKGYYMMSLKILNWNWKFDF